MSNPKCVQRVLLIMIITGTLFTYGCFNDDLFKSDVETEDKSSEAEIAPTDKAEEGVVVDESVVENEGAGGMGEVGDMGNMSEEVMEVMPVMEDVPVVEEMPVVEEEPAAKEAPASMVEEAPPAVRNEI